MYFPLRKSKLVTCGIRGLGQKGEILGWEYLWPNDPWGERRILGLLGNTKGGEKMGRIYNRRAFQRHDINRRKKGRNQCA